VWPGRKRAKAHDACYASQSGVEPVPTLAEWALVLLALTVASLGARALRRRA
jgi:hypothetical protein